MYALRYHSMLNRLKVNAYSLNTSQRLSESMHNRLEYLHELRKVHLFYMRYMLNDT